MKLLITGAKGQLGRQITSMIENKRSRLGDIDKIYYDAELKSLSSKELDITRLEDVLELTHDFKPDAIINCAAYTNVDKCETDMDNAFKVNALGARNLAIAADKIHSKILQVSTDYVFDGNSKSPVREYEVPSPESVYGKTKLLGEGYIRNFCGRYFIVRTAWLYGRHGKNFVYTIMNAGKDKGHLNVVNDQIGNPTNAEDLAYHILKIIRTNEYGIYHCTGKNECSWYDFACKIIEYSRINCKVYPMTSDKLDRAAKRPAYSSLDNMMLRLTVGDEMRPWDMALKDFINTNIL